MSLKSLHRHAGLLASFSLIVAAFIPSGCSREAVGSDEEAGSTDSTPRASAAEKHHLIDVEAVVYRGSWRISGVLEPWETARPAFLVGGQLVKVFVERGDSVERGQALARLDMAEVRAGVAQAKSAAAAAEAQVKMARDALQRLEPLNQQEVIAGAQVVKVRLQLEAARAVHSQARAAVAMARVKRDQHTLRAPIAGTVLDVPQTLGEIVGPGIPQFEIASLDRLKLVGTLPAEAAGQVREGQQVKIHPQRGSPLEGRISSVLPALTADTHRLPIEVEVEAPSDRPALANSFVEVEVEALESQTAASIPSTALVREDETWVWRVEDGVARRHEVRVLSNQGDQLIVEGVDPSSQVIDMPSVDLTDGSRVTR